MSPLRSGDQARQRRPSSPPTRSKLDPTRRYRPVNGLCLGVLRMVGFSSVQTTVRRLMRAVGLLRLGHCRADQVTATPGVGPVSEVKRKQGDRQQRHRPPQQFEWSLPGVEQPVLAPVLAVCTEVE